MSGNMRLLNSLESRDNAARHQETQLYFAFMFKEPSNLFSWKKMNVAFLYYLTCNVSRKNNYWWFIYLDYWNVSYTYHDIICTALSTLFDPCVVLTFIFMCCHFFLKVYSFYIQYDMKSLALISFNII